MPSVGKLCNLLVAQQHSSGSLEGNIALTALSMEGTRKGRGWNEGRIEGKKENIANTKIHIVFTS